MINRLRRTGFRWLEKARLYTLFLTIKSRRIGSHGTAFLKMPTDPWPGDPAVGKMIVEGRIPFMAPRASLGEVEAVSLNDLWMPPLPREQLAELHRFEWLRDLKALGDNAARRLARDLITNWITQHHNWQSLPWKIDILGPRLSNWILLYDFYGSSADEAFKSFFYKSLFKQVLHLQQVVDVLSHSHPTKPSLTRLQSLKALLIAAVVLKDPKLPWEKFLEAFAAEMSLHFLKDGGHFTRLPYVQWLLLRDLMDVKSLLRSFDQDLPPSLQESLSRMVPIVRLLRHGDGGLAYFGAQRLLKASSVDMALSMADVRGRPPSHAPAMGYERGTLKSHLLLFNAGAFVPALVDEGLKRFNFEWSVGRERILIHADLMLQTEEGQSCQVPLFSPLKEEIPYTCSLSKTSRDSQTTHLYLDASLKVFNFSIHRQLYLSEEGIDFRGEDTLTLHSSGYGGVRFVFQPGIRLQPMTPSHGEGNPKGLWIHLPDGRKWRFLTSGGEEIVIEEVETRLPLSPTPQAFIVLSPLKPDVPKMIRWSFQER